MKRADPVRWFLFTEAALSATLAGTFTIVGVYFVREVGLDPLQLVLVGTVMEVACFVFEIPTGVVADTYSRRASLLLSWLLQGAALVVVGLSPVYATILLAYAFWGFAHTFESGAYEAWITDEVGAENVGPIFLRGARVSYAGALGGMAAVVGLGAWLGLGTAIVIGGISVAAIGLAGIFLMPETGFTPVPRAERGGVRGLGRTAVEGARTVRGRPLLVAMLAIALVAGLSTEGIDRLWEAQFIRVIGLPHVAGLSIVWWFWLLRSVEMLLGLAGTTFLIKRFEKLRGRGLVRTLAVLTALQLITAALFGLAAGLVAAVLAFWAYNLARSLTQPTYMTWLNQTIDDSRVRATVISTAGQADALGQLGGGPAIGAIGRSLGIRAALVAGASVLVPALALYARVLRRERPPAEVPETA